MEKPIYNYSIDKDASALEQFEHCYNQEFVVAAALMPDAHSGYVAPIGSVLLTKDKIVPAWVGFDIGCGLIAVQLKGKNIVEKIREKAKEIHHEVQREVPMGAGEYSKQERITEKTKEEFQLLIKKLEGKKHNKEVLNIIKTSGLKNIGTVGGGNHFIELGYEENEKNEAWIVIHSGSRGLGYKIAERYMKLASGRKEKFEQTFPLDANSDLGREYLAVLDFCLDYALLNRLEMSYKVHQSIQSVLKEKIKSELWVNKNHNHAILDTYEKQSLFFHRKGATPAKKNERGVIPGSMLHGSFLVKGLGNKEFLYSSSHGAGRKMSRKKAKESLSMEEFKESMSGITSSIRQEILDEAPMAYKNIFEVMAAQKDSVEIVKHILPLINWKGK